MPRAALTLEVLAREWHAGGVDALAICGHPHGRVPVPDTAHATQVDRWYVCLYGHRRGEWDVVREAEQSVLKARTWWSVDQCLRQLAKRGVHPEEICLRPRGPAPPEFPELPRETRPTESARRKPPKAAPRKPIGKRRSATAVPAWLAEEAADDSPGEGDDVAPGKGSPDDGW